MARWLGDRVRAARTRRAAARALLTAVACVSVFRGWAGSSRAHAGETTDLEPILVTESRPQFALAAGGRVTVIAREEIERLPGRSVEEVIAQVAGVDVRQRGPRGVQADVSIRGGTFEQTLVLIDGVKVADPQTGHHAFDVPIAPGEIERIEVLKGAASRAWGPNAFAGVVNIVTRRAGGRSVSVRAQGGSDETLAGGATVAAAAARWAARVAAEGSRSSGHRANTDHEIGTLSLSGVLPLGPLDLDLLAGHTEKDFGANGFYTTLFPNQREETGTTFATLGEDFAGGRFVVSPRLFWRRHRDRYLLDHERPDFYQNRHRTDVAGGEIQGTLDSGAGLTSFGAEWALEAIDSSSLGDHERRRGGLFGNHRLLLGRAALSAGAFAAYHTGWGWEFWPGADAAVDLGGGARLFGSIDKSYRVPTYTELFYVSPANFGNPGLVPEEAWTWETGADWRGGGHRVSAAFFRREGENLIDWVRTDPTQPWRVENSARLRTDGVELAWEWRAAGPGGALEGVRAGYTFLDSDRETNGLESKYVLDHLRHQAVLTLDHALWLGASQRWRFAWEERMNGEEHVVVDTRIRRVLGRGELFLDVTNLLDAEYSLVPGVPQPGRSVLVGMSLDLGRR